ncbi:MAG TPA: FAD-dependent monooxygenase [Anaerovoracaceae bacterium]|nr:FAD-dependent monooxygenase [Anaerovoracaceae bacterium]
MKNVLIIGGGLAGCTVAKELSAAGIGSCIVEKSMDIGGKVRGYGCKSDAKCNICGLCAVGTLWQDVEGDPKVKKFCNSSVIDISEADGIFNALIQTNMGKIKGNFTDVVVATGFEDSSRAAGAGYDTPAFPRVYTGNALEKLMKERGADSIFQETPQSVAFIMCYGSRSLKERASYCSQVCCAYSTRAAKVIKHYYPDTEVVIFYMDLQAVNPGNYAKELTGRGIKLERCRPVDISFEGDIPVVAYEDADGKRKRSFDYLFLNTGIHPDPAKNTALADITGLKVKSDGFLTYVMPPVKTGVYLAGCAVSPMSIADTMASARNAAVMLINNAAEEGNAQ